MPELAEPQRARPTTASIRPATVNLGGTVGPRALKENASELVRHVREGQAFILTLRNEPVGVILPLSVNVEDLVFAMAEPLVRQRDEALEEHRQGLTYSIDDARRVLTGEVSLADVIGHKGAEAALAEDEAEDAAMAEADAANPDDE